MWKVWDMKRSYWSLLKSCWLKSGVWGRSIMVHQWMHPDKVRVRCDDTIYVQKKKEKRNYNHWICLRTSQQNIYYILSHTQKQNLLYVTTPKTWFQNMKDDIKITWDGPTVSFFFNFTLLLKESQGQGPPGSGSKLVSCAEQSTVKHYAWGLIQAYSEEMTPSSICHAMKSRWKA